MSTPENTPHATASPRPTGSLLPVIASLIAVGTVFWMPHFAITVALGTLVICALTWKDGSHRLLGVSVAASGAALLLSVAHFTGLWG
ncbi:MULTISPECIES: hypothetical protein [Actinomycetes]|uniref:DUF4190 domain-containing protein n=2 Tax=Actinomycetes TaxID=1760 RepID=A0ABP6M085_9MICC|nr:MULTISPECIES: hypothetical protein [unclassified Nesterenkonia]MDS2172811.1 hypothetical protein [Nesterenkonia sp. CL21]OSM42883.1 hypothetical protein BCY76_011895 [Nesterenkonia sp. PF2B19]